MTKTNQRHGLIDIYKFILGFWVMFHHNFFFMEHRDDIFSVAQLAVDFFFVISGYFLLRSMEKKKDVSIAIGLGDLLLTRIKPLLFSVCFISAFNFLCICLFVKEDILANTFYIFRYWWYVLYLLIAVILFYLLFRMIRSKRGFVISLFIITCGMAILDYFIEKEGFLIYELTFWTRTFGCTAAGMLISYIPKWKPKKFNINIPIVILLILLTAFLAYGEKNFITCLIMIGLFTALVYFSTNIAIGGRITDLLGQLGTRMYLYMSFITTLYILGLTHHRILFVIDLTLAVMDLLLSESKKKYEKLKAQSKTDPTL